MLIVLALLAQGAQAQDADVETTNTDSVKSEHRSLGQTLLKPLNWVRRNWSAYDPSYSIPSFYNWVVQFQNTSSLEWLRTENPEGMDVEMTSRMSHRVGPYLGWSFLFYGFTVDLSTIGKPASNKNEFTLSVNSNLANIDIIRRRTGSDFSIDKLDFFDSSTGQRTSLKDYADNYKLGNYIKNSITGINLNFFVNHRHYSNPAAFSNGAIQLRSVGSPIVGFGYTHQLVESDISEVVSTVALDMASKTLDENDLANPAVQSLLDHGVDNMTSQQKGEYALLFLDKMWNHLKENEKQRTLARSILANRVPTTTRIDDWHLQLGYAYNWVLSRRLLVGASLVLSPGLKRVRADNHNSLSYNLADGLSQLIKKNENIYVDPSFFRYEYDRTRVNMNAFARLSITYNHNRWRAGVMANYSNYYYNHHGMDIDNAYGNLTTYVGYCFGRKKQYRHDGSMRKDYIMTALTPRQIEEMNDSMPAGNLDRGPSYKAEMGRTPSYHNDVYTLELHGCDLVAGPEGRYGWLEIEEGFVTPGQDTEGRLRKGLVVDIGKNGNFTLTAGHKSNFRTGNWWKSQLSIDQIPNTWYPEMLNYGLSGRLTLYLRGRIFGSRKPMKMVLDDVCLNHGKETKDFSQVAIKSFRSNSPYSIEGFTMVNGRECRVFIEQRGNGRLMSIYVSRLYPVNAEWMSYVENDRPLSSISIPGTHDSGTASLNASPVLAAAQTQNFSVPEQLRDGIRAFDLRLKKDLRYGHFLHARDNFESTIEAWDKFLDEHPSECIVALIGSDGGGKWEEPMRELFMQVVRRYPHRFVESFDATSRLGDMRGKILVLRRQESCPYGKLLEFEDNAVFNYDCFRVEDVYKEHKTWKKLRLVEQNIREAYENEDVAKWYLTFNNVAWSPRRHTPYSYAWGGRAIRKPLNKSLREVIELKDYGNFGVVFLDFYNDHGENPHVVRSIIESNFRLDNE